MSDNERGLKLRKKWPHIDLDNGIIYRNKILGNFSLNSQK